MKGISLQDTVLNGLVSLGFLFKYIFYTSGQLWHFIWRISGHPPMELRFLAFACGFFLAFNNFGWSSGHRCCETDIQAYTFITLGL